MKQQITANFKACYKLSSNHAEAENSKKMSLTLHHLQNAG